MPPKKKARSIRRRKRRFTNNQYTIKQQRREESSEEEDTSLVADGDLGLNQDDVDDRENRTEMSAELETPKSRRDPASIRKLAMPNENSSSSDTSEDDSDSEEVGPTTGFRLIDVSILAEMIELLRCPDCKSSVKLGEEKKAKMGFASSFKISCSSLCGFSKQFYTSARIGQAFEVNRRAVLATRNIGVGHKGLVKLAGVLNMPPPMNNNAYRDTVNKLQEVSEKVAQESMAVGAAETKPFYEADEDEVFDVAVSADGTWRKRGFKSSVGVVTVILLLSGKILDTEIMSKECRTCLINTRKEGTKEYDEWWEGHKAQCQVNFHGSSGAMDPAGCVTIFKRSVDRSGLRYTHFLGDGDSKAFKQLKEEKVYGEKVIKKLECVGHIQKRMGSRLRSLKKSLGKTKLDDGKTVGGIGRLTDKVIDSLQVYYGKAIRENTESISKMKDAVMAIWNHSRSTDENPFHHLCPTGKESWCGFQRDAALGTHSYHHSHPLPSEVAEVVRGIFDALSSDILLDACLHGGTQNQNESFNGMIWQRAPKISHSSLRTVQLATNIAIGQFNDGYKTILRILEEAGVTPGRHCKSFCQKEDEERIYMALYKSTDRAKKRRRAIRNKKKGYADQLEHREGPQYQPGGF